MGTISNALSSYYQLANLLSSGSGSSLSGSTSSPSSVSPTQMLAAALDAAQSSSSGSGSGSYLLSLSPTAQSLLGSSSSSSSSGSSTFSLTTAQQTKIKDILEQYKNSPDTQATFDAIQNALQAAGLSPQTLGAEDQVKSFNPTDTLLSALNGTNINIQDPNTTAAGEQTKKTNYIQTIANMWKVDMAAASSASGTSTPSTIG